MASTLAGPALAVLLAASYLGTAAVATGKPILIDGLWALKFGNDGNGGSSQTLYFTAGPNGEADGLFGALSPVVP